VLRPGVCSGEITLAEASRGSKRTGNGVLVRRGEYQCEPNLRPSIQFTMKTEPEMRLPFSMFWSSGHVKSGLIQSLHSRASTVCQERQDLVKEMSTLRSDLELSGYPQDFNDSVINSKGSSRLNKEQKPLGSVYISHMWRVFLRSSDVLEIDTSGRSSKSSRLLGVHSWKEGRNEVRYKRHSASIVSPVSVQKLHWWNRQTSSRAAPGT
jgi:hypothetical protein